MGLRQMALGVLNDNIFNLLDYFLKAMQPLINILKNIINSRNKYSNKQHID